jgi:CRISPR-associated protein Csd1
MILRRLAEHYDRIVAGGIAELPKAGFSDQLVSFCIVLNADGQLVHFEDLRGLSGTVLVPKLFKLPGQTKSSGRGLNPCFLWDRIGYLLGVSYDPDHKKQNRALKAFKAFRRRHIEYRNRIDDFRFGAVCNFLENWEPPCHVGYEPELKEISHDCGVFRIAGSNQYLHELVAQPDGWSAGTANKKSGARSVRMCIVTGEPLRPARLHKPEIKGIFGADSKGMPLVSFNLPASTSYGYRQGVNAPVSEIVVFKYANALNHLIRERRLRLGNWTIVYWADHPTPIEDSFAFLFSGERSENKTQQLQDDPKRLQEAKLLLSQMRSGTQNGSLPTDDFPTRFFILGLSPNASRLSVRLWIEADASEILLRLREHVRDFSLVGGYNDLPAPLWRIALATGRAEFDQKGRLKDYAGDPVSSKLAGDLARSVLTGAAYPQYMLATMARRIYSDGHVSFERVSAMKACLVRNTRFTPNPLEIPMELDVNRPDIAYQCGRIFAILEAVQERSVKQNCNAKLNTTIKDHYFSAASSKPALLFPRLCRLSKRHLAKINPPQLRNYFESKLSQAMGGKGFVFPRQLAPNEQASFIIGYYQQRNFRKDDQNNDKTGESQ